MISAGAAASVGHDPDQHLCKCGQRAYMAASRGCPDCRGHQSQPDDHDWEETVIHRCQECKRTFASAQGLAVHNARTHGPNKTAKVNGKPSTTVSAAPAVVSVTDSNAVTVTKHVTVSQAVTTADYRKLAAEAARDKIALVIHDLTEARFEESERMVNRLDRAVQLLYEVVK